jgi:hypothetical protein
MPVGLFERAGDRRSRVASPTGCQGGRCLCREPPARHDASRGCRVVILGWSELRFTRPSRQQDLARAIISRFSSAISAASL